MRTIRILTTRLAGKTLKNIIFIACFSFSFLPFSFFLLWFFHFYLFFVYLLFFRVSLA